MTGHLDNRPHAHKTGDVMNEITDGLQALIAHDFSFAHPRDSSGSLIAVVGIRAHRGVIDIIQLYDERDAIAARLPGDEPDVLFPRRVIWRTNGTAHEVIGEMLAMGDPAPEQGTNGDGCWVPTHAGRSIWLAASA